MAIAIDRDGTVLIKPIIKRKRTPSDRRRQTESSRKHKLARGGGAVGGENKQTIENEDRGDGPGAAKRAQAAPRVTAYAAAMVKKRVLEIFNELMAGDAGEGASAAAAVALEKTISELPMSRGASEQ